MSWSYIKNFKMHLHPAAILQKNDLPLPGIPSLHISHLRRDNPPLELPPNVDLLKVYSDFLRYLFTHTQTYLRECTDSDPWQ